MVKNPPINAGEVGDAGYISESERSPGQGNSYPLQYSCVENLMDRGAWQAAVWGITKSWTRLKRLSIHYCPTGEMLIFEIYYFVTLLLSLLLTIKVSIPNFYRKLGPAGLIVKNKGEHLQERLKVSGTNNHVNLGILSFNIKMSW